MLTTVKGQQFILLSPTQLCKNHEEGIRACAEVLTQWGAVRILSLEVVFGSYIFSMVALYLD